MRLPDIDLRLFVSKPPFWLVALLVLSVVGSWIPLALIARQRVSKHAEPRIHIFQDMGNQAKLKTQKVSPVFADGRAMRPRLSGTVARGELHQSDHLYLGYEVIGEETKYFEGFPVEVKVDKTFVITGQLRFNTYCAPCHGASGYGNGSVQQRADELKGRRGNPSGTVWTQVANLHAETFQEEAYLNGKLFNTISNGKGAMNGYAAQITPEDRWAIVAYVRALQQSQNTPYDELSPEQKQLLEAQQPVAVNSN